MDHHQLPPRMCNRKNIETRSRVRTGIRAFLYGFLMYLAVATQVGDLASLLDPELWPSLTTVVDIWETNWQVQDLRDLLCLHSTPPLKSLTFYY